MSFPSASLGPLGGPKPLGPALGALGAPRALDLGPLSAPKCLGVPRALGAPKGLGAPGALAAPKALGAGPLGALDSAQLGSVKAPASAPAAETDEEKEAANAAAIAAEGKRIADR